MRKQSAIKGQCKGSSSRLRRIRGGFLEEVLPELKITNSYGKEGGRIYNHGVRNVWLI